MFKKSVFLRYSSRLHLFDQIYRKQILFWINTVLFIHQISPKQTNKNKQKNEVAQPFPTSVSPCHYLRGAIKTILFKRFKYDFCLCVNVWLSFVNYSYRSAREACGDINVYHLTKWGHKYKKNISRTALRVTSWGFHLSKTILISYT